MSSLVTAQSCSVPWCLKTSAQSSWSCSAHHGVYLPGNIQATAPVCWTCSAGALLPSPAMSPETSLVTLCSQKGPLNDHFQYKPSQNLYKNSLQHETIQKCPCVENWRNLVSSWSPVDIRCCDHAVPASVFLPKVTLKGWIHPNVKGAQCSSYKPGKNKQPWRKY